MKPTLAIASISLFTIFASATLASNKDWFREIHYTPGCVSESMVFHHSKTTIIWPRKRTCINESKAPG